MTNSKKFLIVGWSLYLIFIVIGFLVDKRGGGYYGSAIPLIIILIFALGTIFLLLGFKKNISRILLIVGILIVLGVLLNSNSNGHPKSPDARIGAMISSMRAEAELHIDINGEYPLNICNMSEGPLQQLFYAIKNTNSYETNPVCLTTLGKSGVKDWAVSTKLPKSKEFYCADSMGFSGKVTRGITSPSCAPVKAETSGQ
mgnify:CR=1 FL=1